MDRTSILGDTIDYMKELLDRIQILREEMGEQGDGSYPSSEGLLRLLKNRLSHDEVLIRNAPKVTNIHPLAEVADSAQQRFPSAL